MMNVVYIDTPIQVEAGLDLFSKLGNARLLTSDPRTLLELEAHGHPVETFDPVYDEVALQEYMRTWLPELWACFRRLDEQLQERLPFLAQYDLQPIEKLGNGLVLKLTNYAAALYICAAFLKRYPSTNLCFPDPVIYGPIYYVMGFKKDRNPHYGWAFQRLVEQATTYAWPEPHMERQNTASAVDWKAFVKRALAELKLRLAKTQGLFLDLDEGELSRRVAELDPRGHLPLNWLSTLISSSGPIVELADWPGEISGPVFMGRDLGELIHNDLEHFRDHLLPEFMGLIFWMELHPRWFERFAGLICNRSLWDTRLAMIAEYFCARGVNLLHYQHGGGYGALDMPKFINSDFATIPGNHVFCVWGSAVAKYAEKLKPPAVPCVAVGWKSLARRVKAPTGKLDHILYVPTSMRYNDAGIRAYPYGDFPCTGYFFMQRRLIDDIAAAGCRDMVLKMHSADKPHSPIHRYVEQKGYPFIVDYDSKLSDHLTPSTLVITDFPSTTYCEALAFGCTIIAYQHEATLKPMPAALASMHQSSYVYERFDDFVDAAARAVIHPEDFPPKENQRYLREYVFEDNGDAALARVLLDSDSMHQ